ncbi:MAG: chorismate-binding protein, partial [Muribaculaceae bacterium]|nr:chorismate-binding protein [Muribaculaceae bacterium]
MSATLYPDFYNHHLPFKIALAAFRQRIPFALYVKADNQYKYGPNDKFSPAIDIIVSKPGENPVSDRTFEIGRWGEPSSKRIVLNDTLDHEAMVKLMNSQQEDSMCDDYTDVCRISTSREKHHQQVEEIVSLLKSQPGSRKIVLSRAICGEVKTDDYCLFWLKVASEYFAKHPNTFRFFYYTPQTGAWLGASPEVLLSIGKKDGNCYTVALAGTRNGGTSLPWDTKNTDEQMQVSDFIFETLKNLNYNVSRCSVPNVEFGKLVHKCDMFEFHMNPDDRYKVIDQLNPTPALSGYPRPQAMETIARLEEHDRLCYGGFVAVNDKWSYQAYVNLRSVHLDRNRYCAYAGGGITAMSEPDAE